MPTKLSYSPKKGLVEESGGQFEVNGAPIAQDQHTDATYKGALYDGTMTLAGSSTLDGKYFIIYDKDGTSYGIWWDVDDSGTTAPTPADDADVTFEVTTVAGGNNASASAGATATALNGNATIGAKFEVVRSGTSLKIYVLECGPLTTASVNNGDAGIGFTLTDGAGSALPAIGASQVALVTAGDVTSVAAELAQPGGSVAGQRRLVHVTTAASNGSIVLTGNFSDSGTHSHTKLTFGGATNDEYAQLVWTGTAWLVVSEDGTTAS